VVQFVSDEWGLWWRGGGTRWRGDAAAIVTAVVCSLKNAARHYSKWPAAAH